MCCIVFSFPLRRHPAGVAVVQATRTQTVYVQIKYYTSAAQRIYSEVGNSSSSQTQCSLNYSSCFPFKISVSHRVLVPLLNVARPLHTSAARSSAEKKKPSPLDSLPAVDTQQLVSLTNEAILKLQNATTQQLYHYSSYALLGLTPVAIILSPHFICFPVDFALGLVIPVHMHIGLVGIIEDYVPRSQQPLTRLILAILGCLTAIGLLKVNLCGAGITESVKSLWRRPKLTQEEKAAALIAKRQ